MLHSLSGIIAPSEFKSYEELKEKLDRVSRLQGAVSNSTAESVAEDMEEVPWSNVNTETVAEEPVISSAEATSPQVEEDDAMDYFKKSSSKIVNFLEWGSRVYSKCVLENKTTTLRPWKKIGGTQ